MDALEAREAVVLSARRAAQGLQNLFPPCLDAPEDRTYGEALGERAGMDAMVYIQSIEDPFDLVGAVQELCLQLADFIPAFPDRDKAAAVVESFREDANAILAQLSV